jgi:hypothetical protein
MFVVVYFLHKDGEKCLVVVCFPKLSIIVRDFHEGMWGKENLFVVCVNARLILTKLLMEENEIAFTMEFHMEEEKDIVFKWYKEVEDELSDFCFFACSCYFFFHCDNSC